MTESERRKAELVIRRELGFSKKDVAEMDDQEIADWLAVNEEWDRGAERLAG